MGVSVCEPKVTVAPDATLSAAIVSGKDAPAAGTAIGAKLMMAGAPAVVEGMTVKVALFETSDALVTETLIIPEEETSFEGTLTTIVWHCAMLAVPVGQFTGAETDEGESVSLPKRTIDVISRPVPVIPSGKFPLPARTLVGEIEKMAGVLLEPETAVLIQGKKLRFQRRHQEELRRAACSTTPGLPAGPDRAGIRDADNPR